MTVLTPRERLVVEAVADPSEPTLRQVAQQLGYAYETVNDVLKQVRVKLGTRSAYGLARWLSVERGDVVLTRAQTDGVLDWYGRLRDADDDDVVLACVIDTAIKKD